MATTSYNNVVCFGTSLVLETFSARKKYIRNVKLLKTENEGCKGGGMHNTSPHQGFLRKIKVIHYQI